MTAHDYLQAHDVRDLIEPDPATTAREHDVHPRQLGGGLNGADGAHELLGAPDVRLPAGCLLLRLAQLA